MSLHALKKANIPFELRTTVVYPMTTIDSLFRASVIIAELGGIGENKWYFQNYVHYQFNTNTKTLQQYHINIQVQNVGSLVNNNMRKDIHTSTNTHIGLY